MIDNIEQFTKGISETLVELQKLQNNLLKNVPDENLDKKEIVKMTSKISNFVEKNDFNSLNNLLTEIKNYANNDSK